MANRPSFMQDFINLYRKHKCLWKIKDSTYANRALRTKAYEELLDLYKTVDVEATLESVKNKINNMRSAFRKELKKVKLSKKSGTSPDETYTPSLWYYDSLLFTADQEECRETFSSSMDMQDESEKVDNEENELESDLDNIEASNSVTSETTCSSRTTTPTSRKRPRQTKNDVMLEKAYEVLSSGGDNEFKTVGANVAWKLQRMEENQRNIAEHLINTILHYGITKKLTDNVTIHLNSPNRYGYNIANNIYSQDPINNSQTQHIPSQLYQPSRFVPPPTPFQIQSCTQPQSPNQSQPQFHSQPYSQPPIPPQTEPHSQTHSISQLTQHLNENDTVYSMDNYLQISASAFHLEFSLEINHNKTKLDPHIYIQFIIIYFVVAVRQRFDIPMDYDIYKTISPWLATAHDRDECKTECNLEKAIVGRTSLTTAADKN
ncbi:hypothetical protein MML48_3g00007715 [Holotrichia oblita]|uniref:Uncharacterized protein n=1 Tax=Holotrichia oblita TaxID=644536 RepID=A0ACB9TGK8_HOLOL|nr:hypothetical protein MML48_3g00007715 [Holotrichia oblita]